LLNKIKGFIFDMDGVITETSEYHYMAWKLLASHIGIYIDRNINEQLKGISRMDSLNIILKHGNREKDFTETERLALATSKNKRYVDMISQFNKSNLLPGVEDIFKELKARGIKIGIASASHSANKLIELLGIKEYVDFIVDPGTVPSKPAPDIFLAAAKGIGVKPSQCIGVEDAIAGIESIKHAKIYAVGIGDSDVLKAANVVYKTVADISLDKLLTTRYKKEDTVNIGCST